MLLQNSNNYIQSGLDLDIEVVTKIWLIYIHKLKVTLIW